MQIKLLNLKELFLAFVRTRSINRHFRRLAILEMIKGGGGAKEFSPALVQTLLVASSSD
jgi:Mg2+-importing ATPase